MLKIVRSLNHCCMIEPLCVAMDCALHRSRCRGLVYVQKVAVRNVRVAYATQSKSGAVLLVESPAKARKIQGFLGDEYKVLPSYGHVRDLPSKAGAVQPSEGFSMQWELMGDAKARVRQLAQEVKGANKLILATDPDREGEAISWHVLQELQARNALDGVVVERITFTEVTQTAIMQALQQPRAVSSPLVDAYLARRALDYLVGFNMSPVLWRKLPGSKSAGRVQSVALRLICRREDERDRFVSQQYWTVLARVQTSSGAVFDADLTHFEGTKLGKLGIADRDTALKAAERIQGALLMVKDVTGKEVQRSPSPPFITSSLQIEASRKLGMSTQRTMSAAQSLYEGASTGEGLITYMRTDGLHIAPSAVSDIRSTISNEFGSFFLPPTTRAYKSKSVNAQEAHEAIRPTKMYLTPKMLEGQLSGDELKLYRLIWTRTAASQMSNAKLKQVAAVLESESGDVTLRASGSQVVFPGYLQAYDDGDVLSQGGGLNTADESDDASYHKKSVGSNKDAGKLINQVLGELQVGHKVAVQKVVPEEHSTKPPGRFSEGSLVKELESLGIGRPSTYASIIRVLLQRGYVDKNGQSLKPSAKGRVVTGFLVEYFTRYMDYDFTAFVESQLDEISASRVDWLSVMADFWGPFHTSVEGALAQRNSLVYSHLDKTLEHLLYPPRADGSDPRTCPACGSPLHLKVGKNGPFVGCTNYEKKKKSQGESEAEEGKSCTYARPIGEDPLGGIAEGASDTDGSVSTLTNGRQLGPHPVTGDLISVRNGPYGPYLQVGEVSESNPRPRRITIKGMKDLNNLTLETALTLMGDERMVGPHPDDNTPITSGIGPYGPYVSHQGIYAALRKGQEVGTVTLEAAVQLLAAKRERIKAKAEAAGKKLPGKSEKSRGKAEKAGQTAGTKGRKRGADASLEGGAKKSKAESKSTSESKSKAKSKTESKSKSMAESKSTVKDESASEGDGVKKKLKAGEEAAVHKAVSGYVLWMREEKARVAAEHPELTPAAVLKRVREAWKTLDPTVKEQYNAHAAVQQGPIAGTEVPLAQETPSTSDAPVPVSLSGAHGSDEGAQVKKPGKGLLAYALFVREERERQTEAEPELKPAEALKRAREAWKTLDASVKQQYTLRAMGVSTDLSTSSPSTSPSTTSSQPTSPVTSKPATSRTNTAGITASQPSTQDPTIQHSQRTASSNQRTARSSDAVVGGSTVVCQDESAVAEEGGVTISATGEGGGAISATVDASRKRVRKGRPSKAAQSQSAQLDTAATAGAAIPATPNIESESRPQSESESRPQSESESRPQSESESDPAAATIIKASTRPESESHQDGGGSSSLSQPSHSTIKPQVAPTVSTGPEPESSQHGGESSSVSQPTHSSSKPQVMPTEPTGTRSHSQLETPSSRVPSSSPGTPGRKRPLTGYNLFVKLQRPVLTAANPGAKASEIVKLAAQAWKGLDAAAKAEYQTMAAQPILLELHSDSTPHPAAPQSIASKGQRDSTLTTVAQPSSESKGQSVSTPTADVPPSMASKGQRHSRPTAVAQPSSESKRKSVSTPTADVPLSMASEEQRSSPPSPTAQLASVLEVPVDQVEENLKQLGPQITSQPVKEGQSVVDKDIVAGTGSNGVGSVTSVTSGGAVVPPGNVEPVQVNSAAAVLLEASEPENENAAVVLHGTEHSEQSVQSVQFVDSVESNHAAGTQHENTKPEKVAAAVVPHETEQSLQTIESVQPVESIQADNAAGAQHDTTEPGKFAAAAVRQDAVQPETLPAEAAQDGSVTTDQMRGEADVVLPDSGDNKTAASNTRSTSPLRSHSSTGAKALSSHALTGVSMTAGASSLEGSDAIEREAAAVSTAAGATSPAVTVAIEREVAALTTEADATYPAVTVAIEREAAALSTAADATSQAVTVLNEREAAALSTAADATSPASSNDSGTEDVTQTEQLSTIASRPASQQTAPAGGEARTGDLDLIQTEQLPTTAAASVSQQAMPAAGVTMEPTKTDQQSGADVEQSGFRSTPTSDVPAAVTQDPTQTDQQPGVNAEQASSTTTSDSKEDATQNPTQTNQQAGDDAGQAGASSTTTSDIQAAVSPVATQTKQQAEADTQQLGANSPISDAEAAVTQEASGTDQQAGDNAEQSGVGSTTSDLKEDVPQNPTQTNQQAGDDAEQPGASPTSSPALKEAESVLAKLQASVRNLKERVMSDFERQEGESQQLEEQMSLASKFWRRMTGGIMKPPQQK